MITIPNNRRISNELLMLVKRKFPNYTTINSAFKKLGIESAQEILENSKSSPENIQLAQQQLEITQYQQELCVINEDEYVRMINLEKDLQLEEQEHRLFHQSKFDADFKYWSMAHYWTEHEATLLMVGKDPRELDFETIQRNTKYSPFATRVIDIEVMINRAMAGYYDRINPLLFIQWANQYGLEIPRELKKLILARHTPPVNWEAKYKELKLKYDELEQEFEKHAQGANATLKHFENWFVEFVANAEKRITKDAILDLYRKQHPENSSLLFMTKKSRDFERVWKKSAPESWKK